MAAFSCLSYCLAYAFVVVFSKIHRFCSLYNKCVLWLQSRSCFAAIFVTWLCRACVGTRGLISLNFSRPGLVSTMFCGSRAEVVLRQFFVTWLCRAYVRTRGLNFAIIFTPWSYLHCVLWLQSRSYFAAIFVTWLCRGCVRTRSLISINFITPWSCLQFVLRINIVAPEQK